MDTDQMASHSIGKRHQRKAHAVVNYSRTLCKYKLPLSSITTYSCMAKMPMHYYTAICAANRNLLMVARTQLTMEELQC